MYLSRLVFDPWNREARRDLASAYELHKTLLSCGFDGVAKPDIGRVLFRVDADPRGASPPVVLVQTDRRPCWANLPTGRLLEAPECKAYDPRFGAGQRLRFRLRANPSKRVAAGNPTMGAKCGGKRVGLLHEADQLRWLLGKAAGGGFVVPGAWADGVPHFEADAQPEGRVLNGKTGFVSWFLSVRFEGCLTVTDPAAFRALLESGVGPAKGYGFGLLSVAPV